MTARNRFFVVLSFGVIVTVASLVALYGREELVARESAVSQAETAAASVAASIDPNLARSAANSEFAAAATLKTQLVNVQLSNPRHRKIAAYAGEPGTQTYRVAAEVGGTPDRNRAGTQMTIDDADAMAAIESGNAKSSWSRKQVTSWTPLWSGNKVVGLIQLDFDAEGIGGGIAPALFALSLGLLITLLLVAFVSRSIGRRLGVLLDGTRRLAQGDLAHRVEVRGHDEISELASSFNQMADSLEENRASLGSAIADLGRASAQVEARAEDNERLLKRTVDAVDDERRRLATELHDSTIQSLQSLGMMAEYAEMLLERDRPAEARDRIATLRDRLNESVADLRRLLFDLRPPNLDDTGLDGSLRSRLEEVAGLADLKASLDFPADIEIPPALETVIYRFCQEALSNVVRHADASTVEVRVWRYGDTLRVAVVDDGKGFDADDDPGRGHFGIQGLRERAQLAGGDLQIESRLGSRTRIELTLPITPSRAESDSGDQDLSNQAT